MSVRTLRIMLWVAVAMASGALAFYSFRGSSEETLKPVAFEIGGAFSMTDHTGRAVTEKDFAGTARAMFFGFTSCPDICPTTMTRMAEFMKALGPAADRLKVILVSVDPERDTPDLLNVYVEAFDERFVGLTGTNTQLEAFAKAYKFYYKKVPTADGSYTMDHSAGVYLYDASGAFRGTLDVHEPDAVALGKLRKLIGS
ncbi:MAG: SCO family protein [Proteobacteria bacterium]|nr:SCO family protein [Pseudomonadota bacterium]